MALKGSTFIFKNINNALKGVLDWKELGAQLGINYVKLQEIEKNKQLQVADCRMELINHWQQVDVSASWQKLCDALTKMDLPDLVRTIRNTYCLTGAQVTVIDHEHSMDTKCKQDIVLKIALLPFDWKSIGKHLLDDQCVDDIDREERREQNKREKMLTTWLQREGCNATYGRLVEILKELKFNETAEEVIKLVMGNGGSGIRPSPSQQRSALQPSKPTQWIPSIAGTSTSGQEVASDGDGEEQDGPAAVNETVPNQSSGSTPHPKVTEVKDDCWMVRAGGIVGKAYKMDKHPHGIALIISNIKFDQDENGDPPNRDGGDKDELALDKLFKKLDYNVVLLKDLEGNQIEKALKIITGHESFSSLRRPKDKQKLRPLSNKGCLVSPDHDSFVLCLMSHGEECVILGVDGGEFKVNEIYPIVGECVYLSNKPKMVFVQACRGSEVPSADGDVARKPDDLFFSFATFIGHAAFRGKNGSWYVKDLCSVFEENYKTKDFMKMLIEVNDAVQSRKDVEEDGQIIRQVPHITGALRRSVYFGLKQ